MRKWIYNELSDVPDEFIVIDSVNSPNDTNHANISMDNTSTTEIKVPSIENQSLFTMHGL